MNNNINSYKGAKKPVSLILSLVLIISCLCFPAAASDTPSKETVAAELNLTAGAMLDAVRANVSNQTVSYNDFKNYALILKAGISDDTVTNSLIDYIKNHFYSDGTANLEGDFYPAAWYVYIITFLNETKEDASDFNGINFNKLLEDYYLDSSNDVNIYMEQYIAAAVEFNRDAFTNPDDILTKAKNTVLDSYKDDASGTGIDYWGISVDNNGQCLSVLAPYYASDDDIKNKADAALAWTETQFSENNAILSWGSESASSTALALKAFAEFGDMENASRAYGGLLTLKASDIEGAYTGYTGSSDLSFSTPDALMGLLAYYRALAGKSTLEVVKADEPETTAEAESAAQTETTASNDSSTAIGSNDNINSESPATGDFEPIALLFSVIMASGIIYAISLKAQRN